MILQIVIRLKFKIKANSEGPDQTAHMEQSDQGLDCGPLTKPILNQKFDMVTKSLDENSKSKKLHVFKI